MSVNNFFQSASVSGLMRSMQRWILPAYGSVETVLAEQISAALVQTVLQPHQALEINKPLNSSSCASVWMSLWQSAWKRWFTVKSLLLCAKQGVTEVKAGQSLFAKIIIYIRLADSLFSILMFGSCGVSGGKTALIREPQLLHVREL